MRSIANSLVLMVTLAACGPITGTIDDTPVGLWTLVTFNGSTLPMILPYPDGSMSNVELMAGRVLLNRDRTCTQSSDVRRLADDVVIQETTDEFPCTWQGVADELQFDYGGGYSTSATWDGDRIVEQMPNDPPTASTRERVWTR